MRILFIGILLISAISAQSTTDLPTTSADAITTSQSAGDTTSGSPSTSISGSSTTDTGNSGSTTAPVGTSTTGSNTATTGSPGSTTAITGTTPTQATQTTLCEAFWLSQEGDGEGETSPTSVSPTTSPVGTTSNEPSDGATTTGPSVASTTSSSSGSTSTVVTGGSTVSGASSTTGATPGSTVNIGTQTYSTASLTTICGTKPTTQAGTTTPLTTTLPPVPLKYVDFSLDCQSSATQCIYTYNSPVNKASFLATEQAIIDDDKRQFSTLASNVNGYQTSVNQAMQDASAKLDNLRQQLQAAQEALNTMQQQLTASNANLDITQTNLISVNAYLSKWRKDRNSCYYAQCLGPRPTTLPPPTTSPPPTTTASPCLDFGKDVTDCNCKVDSKGIPYCSKCDGNLDGYTACETGKCVANGVVIGAGLFDSPGMNIDGTITSYGNNTKCIWTLPSDIKVTIDQTSYNVTYLDDSSSLTITYNNGNNIQSIKKATNFRAFNNLFAQPGPWIITLNAGSNVPDGSFFTWKSMVNTGSEVDYDEYE